MTDPTPRLRSTDPADGGLVAEFDVDGPEQVAAAVARAREASTWWAGLGSADRERRLLRWAAHLTRHAEEITALVRAENGKPRDDVFLELTLTLEHIRWAARHARSVLRPRSVSPGPLMANHAARVEQRPLGVVGVIGPWNYPLFTPNGSIAYALAAGNAVVFKPSEHTPAVGRWYVEAFAAANPDAPAGVLSAVQGGGETGAALCRAGVDKLAFTGSTATGKKIMATCAETLTPVLVECGGKDALIVAADADLTAAADAAAWGAMSNSGQTCVGVERIYVVREVRDRFLAELEHRLRRVRAGVHYGPMTVPAQVEIVRGHVADALEHGATARVGGAESVSPPYVDPVLLVDADEDSAAVREETFGPTVTVRTVESVDEAVRLANATDFGLAATVFSRGRGMEIARRIRAGATSVNAVLGFAAVAALPFGGVGASGFGRIHGAEGLLEFSRSHSLTRQRFALPGMALMSFERTARTMRLVERIVRWRHGRAR
ncbi:MULTISPECIES: aldehyde dehydrogenase family protein [unclassified Saccharopolyspora]|uniref:aldehyde dehydrogenase family protein n=1 Tax=unclassified Saccharopolyspora TaxID=2646250 RepID=UPI001CD3160C|nr:MULTISPECIES: aldehyde dehydrogenase family protein [unclassified Saccharopolyspora]MCA1186303.1 aldehyde dehydrogenase family protein [Saccharopolyspora sp. 6T]MCA1225799.1 aldehyde dehydrogenase family protein [Saccharopolyspora sp. 6M]MCA1280002.1 aldehyde dehydrogenase family protein [Saccharopolyspora sp. 7B]